MTLRPDLQALVAQLLASSEDAREISIDELGTALGTTPAGTEELEEMLTQLEAQGRRITGPRPGIAREHLQQVLPAAHALTKALGRKPTVDELAARTGLDPSAIRAALALGRVLGR